MVSWYTTKLLSKVSPKFFSALRSSSSSLHQPKPATNAQPRAFDAPPISCHSTTAGLTSSGGVTTIIEKSLVRKDGPMIQSNSDIDISFIEVSIHTSLKFATFLVRVFWEICVAVTILLNFVTIFLTNVKKLQP